MAPKKISWQRTVATMQAQDLARDDDFLSHILIDTLASDRPLGVHKMDPTRPLPKCDSRDVLRIVRKLVVPQTGKGKLPSYKMVEPAVDALLELPPVRQYLKGKTQRQINCFATHASRYFELYLPNGQIEIASTSRYTWKTGKSELCVLATQPLGAVPGAAVGSEFKGQKIHELKGSIADLTNKEDDELRRSSGSASQDFSVIYSHQKGCNQLFLGPARFVNHDCNPNAELFRDGKYITFRVLRPIAVSEEITASYGPDYFGKQNKHCLCATCEEAVRGGYAPAGTYAETSDSEREKEFLKRQANELLGKQPEITEGPKVPDVLPDSNLGMPKLIVPFSAEFLSGLPSRRGMVPLMAVPSGIEDTVEVEHDATSCADTDGEVVDISDSEGELEPSPTLPDTDVELDDGRETDEGPQGAEETDAPMDISDSEVDSPPLVRISLNPSSPPSSPTQPLPTASAIAARLGLVKPDDSDPKPRLKLRVRTSDASPITSTPSSSRPSLLPSALSAPTLPSPLSSTVASTSSVPARRTRASMLSTPTESVASTPPPVGPSQPAPRRASSRLNSTKDKQEVPKVQVPTPPLSDEGLIAAKDKTAQRSLRSRAGAASAPASTQPSTRVTRRAFLKPAAPRPATPTIAPARPEKKVARKGKDCQVCFATLPKPNRDDPPKMRTKCFRCDRHYAIFGVEWPKRFMGKMVPLPELQNDSDVEVTARHQPLRSALRNKPTNIENTLKRPMESDKEDEQRRATKRLKTHRRMDKAEREAKVQRKKEKEARRQARVERREEKRKRKEERKEQRKIALAGITNLINSLPVNPGVSAASSTPFVDKENVEPACQLSRTRELIPVDLTPAGVVFGPGLDVEGRIVDLLPEVRVASEEEPDEESEDEGSVSFEELHVVFVPPRHRSFLGQTYRPNPHNFGRTPRFVYEDDPILDVRDSPFEAALHESDASSEPEATHSPLPLPPKTAPLAPNSIVDFCSRRTPPASDLEDQASDLSEVEDADSEWEDNYNPSDPDARSVASPSRRSIPVPCSLPSPPRSDSPGSDPDECIDDSLPLRTTGMWRKWTPLTGACRHGVNEIVEQSVCLRADVGSSDSEDDSQWGSTLSDLTEEALEAMERTSVPLPSRRGPPTYTYTSFNRSLLAASGTRVISKCNTRVAEYTGIDDEGMEVTPFELPAQPLHLPSIQPSRVDISFKEAPWAHPDSITLCSFDDQTNCPVPHTDEWADPLKPFAMPFLSTPDPPTFLSPEDLPKPIRAASYRPVTPVSMTDSQSKCSTPFAPDGKGAPLLSKALRQNQEAKRAKKASRKSKAAESVVAATVSLGR